METVLEADSAIKHRPCDSTFHPVGQFETPLVIVVFVPSVGEHINVPEDATLRSQLVVALPGFQAVNATLISFICGQDWNIE
jgi:hypothetical protein